MYCYSLAAPENPMHRYGQKTKIEAYLLVTDNHGSVIGAKPPVTPYPLVYTAYGYRPGCLGLEVMLGFNGQRKAPVTGCYPLGNGYRDYDPCLMRFRSPDNLSPFGEGGINAYVYCAGNPVNYIDPSGHMFKALKSTFGIKDKNKDYYKNAVAATQAIPELAVHGKWFDSSHVTKTHLKKAAKLSQKKLALDTFEPDPSLSAIISAEDQRKLAQQHYVETLSKTLRIITSVEVKPEPPVKIDPLPNLQTLQMQSNQKEIREVT